MPLGPLGGAPVQGFPPQVTGVRLLEARNETAVLDACILRYAAARSACGGAPCAECITALDAVAADCLRPSCGLGGTERGARFVANFRSYRYLSVAKQCLRSLALPHFEAVEDMSCGGAPDGSVRTRVLRVPLACPEGTAPMPIVPPFRLAMPKPVPHRAPPPSRLRLRPLSLAVGCAGRAAGGLCVTPCDGLGDSVQGCVRDAWRGLRGLRHGRRRLALLGRPEPWGDRSGGLLLPGRRE